MSAHLGPAAPRVAPTRARCCDEQGAARQEAGIQALLREAESAVAVQAQQQATPEPGLTKGRVVGDGWPQTTQKNQSKGTCRAQGSRVVVALSGGCSPRGWAGGRVRIRYAGRWWWGVPVGRPPSHDIIPLRGNCSPNDGHRIEALEREKQEAAAAAAAENRAVAEARQREAEAAQARTTPSPSTTPRALFPLLPRSALGRAGAGRGGVSISRLLGGRAVLWRECRPRRSGTSSWWRRCSANTSASSSAPIRFKASCGSCRRRAALARLCHDMT